MDLMIYSDDALEIIKLGEMNQQETLDYYKKHSKNDTAQVKAIIGAYAAELIASAEEEKILLDLTYETIKNIPKALNALYGKQHEAGIADARNKEMTCRSLAAYINLLIINNFDDCSIDARRYPSKSSEARPDRWTGFLSLVLDGQKNSDMLPFVWEGANKSDDKAESDKAEDKKEENGFVLDIGPLVDGYKKLTGGKLTDEGLTNITLKYEKDGPHLILPNDTKEEPHLILPREKDEEPHLIL